MANEGGTRGWWQFAKGVNLSNGKHTRLVSDPALQLRTETKWTSKASSTRSYQYGFAYDENGNRITQHKDGVLTNYTYGDNNEILTAGSDTFTQDIFGNIATKVSGGNTTTYSYNFERNLTGIDYPSTSNDDSHEYDGDGVRMRSKLNGASDWTNFIVCPITGELLAEYTLISSTFTMKSVNTWGIGLISTNREGTKRYFHFDGVGSTVALTQADGTVTDTYSYSAFGVTESSTGASVNPFRFMELIGGYDDGAMGSSSVQIALFENVYLPHLGITFAQISPPLLDRKSAEYFGGLICAKEQAVIAIEKSRAWGKANGFSRKTVRNGKVVEDPCPDGSLCNAYQHCLWMCLVAKHCGGAEFALEVGRMHEKDAPFRGAPGYRPIPPGGAPNPGNLMAMDLYNNNEGINCRTANCETCCNAKARAGSLGVVALPGIGFRRPRAIFPKVGPWVQPREISADSPNTL